MDFSFANNKGKPPPVTLVVIDFDGVIVDCQARFNRAAELIGGKEPHTKEENKIYWGAALDPNYLHLDKMIPGAKEFLFWLTSPEQPYRDAGYSIGILTSRPFISMSRETVAWWREQMGGRAESESFLDYFTMKPPQSKFTKTSVYKSQVISQMLNDNYNMRSSLGGGETATRMLIVIDDEYENRRVALDMVANLPPGVKPDSTRLYGSLAEFANYQMREGTKFFASSEDGKNIHAEWGGPRL